ncbi:hypothetical protein WICMUC_003240 [Wickerhamomyces mucosus]|uniref:Centrosomin N-terminal motif 1 domain-containing protein n=1 Tax=Wickerhamomyces mucosus TaxID=1378264 RepID=A0A9P8TCG5_9ASCO|nr:hypothetical protein WICMUC_003240 [Wickerhamomyces mucosus]
MSAFQSRKLLIESPSYNQKNYEFTPIGGTNSRHKRSTVNANGTNIKLRFNSKEDENSPLRNRNQGGSSFIDESENDTIHYSDKGQEHRNKSKIASPGNSKNHYLLDNVSNPVRQQLERVSELNDENYNLKLKVASLSKFISSITNNDQQELYQQNSELQERMIAMRSEMSLLRQELSKATERNEKQENNEALVEELRAQVRQSSEAHDRLKDYSENNKGLQRTIDSLNEQLHEAKLRLENERVNESNASRSQIDTLEDQLESLKEKLEDANYDLRKKVDELEEKEAEVESLEAEIREYQQRSGLRDSALELQTEELKTMLKSRDKKIISLDEIIVKKDQELEKSSSELNQIKKVLRDKNTHQNDLSKSLNAARKQILLLEEKYEDLSSNRQHRDEINLRLKERLIEVESTNEELQNKLKDSASIIQEQKNVIHESGESEIEIRKLNKEISDSHSQIEELRRNLKKAYSDLDVTKKELQNADQEMIAMKRNNEKTYKAYTEIKNSQIRNNQLNNDAELRSEIEYLASKVEELTTENKQLQSDLKYSNSFQRETLTTHQKDEIDLLLSKFHELKVDVSSKDRQISRLKVSYEKELDRCKDILEDRENELSKLRDQLRSLELTSNQKVGDEKFELLKIKTAKENEIKLLQIQLQNTKEQHEVESKQLKTYINKLKTSLSNNDERIDFLNNTESFESLLKKIGEKDDKVKHLNSLLSESRSMVKDFERKIDKLIDGKVELEDQNRALSAEIDLLNDKMMRYRNAVRDSKAEKVSILELRSELKEKKEDLISSNEEFNRMKRDLISKYRSVSEERDNLRKNSEMLSQKCNELQSDSNSLNIKRKNITLLECQVELYKTKHLKSNYIISDLKFVNSFMLESIQTNSNHIQKDIKKLQSVGIYPDYELIRSKKLTLKVLLKFVIAAVRIKRKTEYSASRNTKVKALEKQIRLIGD